MRPAYGQRSTYQAEIYPIKTFPRYYYASHKFGSDYTDSDYGNVLVRRCIAGVDTQGYIVKDLIENCEQINRPTDAHNKKWDIEYMISDNKEPDWKWYVKPRMRIDTSVSNNTNMQNVIVVNVVIKNFSGDSTITPIRVSNFKNNDIYNGEYIEIYHLGNQIMDITADASFLCNVDTTNNNVNSQVDYRIYWPGNVTVYLDYVRVDDEWAHNLFENPTGNIFQFRNRIQQEISEFGNENLLSYFYMDECPINSFPCIAEVNKIIKRVTATRNKGLFAIMMEETAMNDYGWLKNLPSIDEYTDYILEMDDSLMTDVFLYTCYPFHNKFKYPPNLTPQNLPAGIQYTPSSSPADYNNSMMSSFQRNWMKDGIEELKNGQVVLSYNIMSQMIKKSRLAGRDISPAFFIQAHTFEDPTQGNYTLREPTNEEMMLQGNLALIYGAKQVYLFSYATVLQSSNGGNYYSYGLMNDAAGTSRRTSNYFGQNKWYGALKVSENVQSIGDVLYPENDRSNHLIYIDSRSINPITYPTGIGSGLPFLYIDNIRSRDPNIIGENPCANDNPGYSEYYDCPDERYWEFGFFEPNPLNPGFSGDNSKYFIALNKRSTPPDTLAGYNVDRRILSIRFKASELPGFRNWTLINAVTNVKIASFDKYSPSHVIVGEFKPAEAKLLKIVPVIEEGGTLAANDSISGNVLCRGKVAGTDKNITILPGATLTFSDTSVIEMNGGTLTCGVNADNVDAVTLQKTTNGTGWNGLVLNNCENVGIYNTNFSGIKANDTAKAVLISNCGNVYFRRNNFTPSNNAGAIQTVYTNPSFDSPSFRVQECNFNMEQSGYSGISIISNASMTIPIVIEWCTFNTSNDTSNAILMNNITGGAIKNNVITNFSKSIIASSSVIDIYRNTIIGNSGSYGLRCLAGSDLKLKTVSGYYLGGENYIRNYGTSSSCIYSDNSLFDINNGENHFDLNDTVDSKFLTGTLGGVPSDNVDAAKNCFHLDSINNIEANHTMTWYGTTDPVSFTFIAYNCELTQPQDYMVFNYGGYNDTVYYNPGGQGSGFNPKKATNVQEGSYKSLRDTINLNLRKRNYAIVEDKAKQLLTQYPDSLESIGMVQKLYIASLTLDQNGNKIGQLKTYLENLISSNQQNPGLTKRAFYHIQKCKVKLGQYQSALDGFQYIMTQNPYSYEGLVASWDYAATYLLMGQGGSLSGDTEEMTEELNTPADTLLNRMSRNDSKTKTGSDGQKTKIFYEKVKTAAKDDRTKQEEKVKQLEKTIETSKNDATKTQAKTELAVMKTIKESVKIRKPNSVKTHIAIVNSDIKKIFGIGKSTSSNTKNNLIPTSFELHQNYPNPFNPSTKIAFDLPKDAKVKLVIYDILGREIKTLIHNEFRTAGKYITEFNGSNLASGVYFYQLTINNEQLAIKKMVLIK